MGDRCKAFDRNAGVPAVSAPKNLCPSCESHYTRVMKMLVYDYLDLSRIIARSNTFSDDKIARPKPQSTPPIDLTIDTLRSQLVWTVGIWETHVRAAAGLPWRSYLGARDGFNVNTGCTILAPRVDLLAGLPPVLAWHDGHGSPEPFEMPGTEGLLRLAEINRRSRYATGVTERTVRLPGDCPDCGAPTLMRLAGADEVSCAVCRTVWPYATYRQWVSMMIDGLLSPPP
jgi:LSD1 subclass zinc finger protein